MSRLPTPNQQHAFNYFTSRGWSPNFSAAFVATLSGESGQGLNTAPLQGNDARLGGGNGIANWSRERFSALGRPNTLDGQLSGVMKEVDSGQYNTAMGNAKNLTGSNADPRSLTNALTGSAGSRLGFEKPLHPDPIRYSNAPQVGSYGPGGQGNSAPTGGGYGGGSSDFAPGNYTAADQSNYISGNYGQISPTHLSALDKAQDTAQDQGGGGGGSPGGDQYANVDAQGNITGYIAPDPAQQADYNAQYFQDYGKQPTFGVNGGTSNQGGGAPPDGGGHLPGPTRDMGIGGSQNSLRAMTPEEMAADPSAQSGGAGAQSGGGTGAQSGGGTGEQSGGSSGSQSGGSSGDSPAGAPLYLTDPHGVGSVAGEAISGATKDFATKTKETGKKLGEDINKAEADLNKGTTADTASVVGQAGGITQYLGDLTYNVLPRGAAIVLGVVIIAGGMYFLSQGEAGKAL